MNELRRLHGTALAHDRADPDRHDRRPDVHGLNGNGHIDRIGGHSVHTMPQGEVIDLAQISGRARSVRRIADEDRERFERNIAEILQACGMDLSTPGTVETPGRFLQALIDSTEGYEGDPNAITAFPTECRGGSDCRISQIVEGPISFWALCEHHALPFFGSAFVGYIAHEDILGISKLTRLVRVFARRFTVQERLGVDVADALASILRPHGIAVQLEAQHVCTQMRGVREEGSRTRTSVWRGRYESDPDLRREFLLAARGRDG